MILPVVGFFIGGAAAAALEKKWLKMAPKQIAITGLVLSTLAILAKMLKDQSIKNPLLSKFCFIPLAIATSHMIVALSYKFGGNSSASNARAVDSSETHADVSGKGAKPVSDDNSGSSSMADDASHAQPPKTTVQDGHGGAPGRTEEDLMPDQLVDEEMNVDDTPKN